MPAACRFAAALPEPHRRAAIETHPDLERIDDATDELRCYNPTPFELRR